MKYIILFLAFTLNLFAQDEYISKLFPGTWKMEIDNGEFYEEWKIEDDDELIGTSFGLDNGEKSVSEYLYLKKFGGKWAYIADPLDQNITLFALAEHTQKKFVFENKEHYFPQRIIYEFHKDGKLTAAIEGDVKGELKRKEFSFTLIED